MKQLALEQVEELEIRQINLMLKYRKIVVKEEMLQEECGEPSGIIPLLEESITEVLRTLNELKMIRNNLR